MKAMLVLLVSISCSLNLLAQSRSDLEEKFFNFKIDDEQAGIYFDNKGKYALFSDKHSSLSFFLMNPVIGENIPLYDWKLEKSTLHLEWPDSEENTTTYTFGMKVNENSGTVTLISTLSGNEIILYPKPNLWHNMVEYLNEF